MNFLYFMTKKTKKDKFKKDLFLPEEEGKSWKWSSINTTKGSVKKKVKMNGRCFTTKDLYTG